SRKSVSIQCPGERVIGVARAHHAWVEHLTQVRSANVERTGPAEANVRHGRPAGADLPGRDVAGNAVTGATNTSVEIQRFRQRNVPQQRDESFEVALRHVVRTVGGLVVTGEEGACLVELADLAVHPLLAVFQTERGGYRPRPRGERLTAHIHRRLPLL